MQEICSKHVSIGYKLSKRAGNRFKNGYCPELDVSPVLGWDETSYYQSLMGVKRWMIEKEPIDINTKASLQSSYWAIPRQRHLEAALHIMGYLKVRQSLRLVFNPSYPDIDHRSFQEYHWRDFYEGAVEAIPPNTPLLRGKKVDLCMFVGSNHAGDKWHLWWRYVTMGE